MLEQRLNHSFANPATLMTRGHTDLVDPQLGRFIRMHVVHTGGKSDHLSLIDRHGQMMAGIAEELGEKARIDGMIEHIRRDVGKRRLIAGIENLEFEGHEVGLAVPFVSD